ncbi:efflux RND transporter periplasmic adaptor subunit [Geosporobacter ferrireducens]|uniref:Efflux transporter periplasmic adaptor subunit n=1 Tax=Geosporobacter ferrireducens TaxID=1424294 RepID=A0A1D8GEM4_9FIRM|nr:efflux RND transporter periplasmic adaptor subunit [Geosporobacter ferrireducens]AOT69357.1 efflux transporter periplasmic adaptor subunit [Geosporobacter ferrireducens]MTI57045.1 efflux RND transporter periplasmic adaptor subunit [Geosporobacter ferrireducens]
MKKKIIGIILVVIAVSAGAVFMMNRSNAVDVEVAVVERGNIAEYVEELGLVVSENKGNVFSPTAGKVTEVLVKVGDPVEKGAVLVKIDSEQLTRQIMELEAQKSVIMAQYNEAKKPADNREIEKLELQLATQERNVREAQRKRDNSKTLYEAGALSYEEYQAAVTALETETAQLESYRLDLELLKKPISANVASQYEAQLRQLDIQIEELRSRGQDFVITAPVQGTVMMKTVEAGTYLQPGTQVMEIGDQEALYIESDVLVAEIGKVKVGAPVEISHKDLGIDGMQGRIRKIHPQAFSKISDLGIEQKRIKVEIDIEDVITGLRPGYDLDIKIIINSKENTLLIPENAVFQQNGKDYVFVNENNTAVLREIQKGIESKRKVEVLTGFEEGEEVILSPSEKLENGIAIKKL